jgi:hypothetical protein
MPVIGFLGFGSFDTFALYLAAFRRGLGEIGFVEGQNVANHALGPAVWSWRGADAREP